VHERVLAAAAGGISLLLLEVQGEIASMHASAAAAVGGSSVEGVGKRDVWPEVFCGAPGPLILEAWLPSPALLLGEGLGGGRPRVWTVATGVSCVARIENRPDTMHRKAPSCSGILSPAL
jgi:hypothetical protein